MNIGQCKNCSGDSNWGHGSSLIFFKFNFPWNLIILVSSENQVIYSKLNNNDQICKLNNNYQICKLNNNDRIILSFEHPPPPMVA